MPRGPGAVARAGPRAQPSDPPAHATEQGRPAPGPLAVRMKRRQRHPTARRPLGTRTLRRDGSRGPRGDLTLTPPLARVLHIRCEQCLGAGDQIRRCRGWPISPERAGTPRAHRRRETLAPTESLSRGRGTARVTAARRAAGSRALERAAAAVGETQGRTTATAALAKQTPHAVKQREAGPRGETKASTQWKTKVSAGGPGAKTAEARAHDLVALAGRDLENNRQ